ncbi:MAG TPA: 4-alpha-glucanotransferase, partial [Pseudomonadales bacterium]|nr:4-alpha-glucanotransferase [Pseudomonadales bacterium]
NDESWQVSLEWPASSKEQFSYDYLLKNADGSVVQDWGRDRSLAPAEFRGDELLVIDSWNDAGAVENVFYTEPFQEVLLAKNFTEVRVPAPSDATHTFRVKAPLLGKGQTVCLLGDGPLGNWDTAKPILLGRLAGESDFSARLDLRSQKFPLTYKYGVFDVEKNTFIRFEDGADRVLNDSPAPAQHIIINDGFIRLPLEPWRGAGVAIPVFSLRSEQSFGVGEFLDLKPLADWGKQIGLKLIQILPVNDTTATRTSADSYPYAAISAFALHPIYLNLAAVANAENKKLLTALESQRLSLNALGELDYETVIKTKLDFLKQIFPSQKAATFNSQEYKTFIKENEHWLAPYAAFCALRDKFGTADFNKWPEHQKYDANKIAAFAKDNDDVAFHLFIQFHLHQQLKEATEYARANGIIVKGDIAIGVFRHGADVWQEPELFHMDAQAGAPPDPFAAKGQNWGFPTYNWPRMEADGFAWWKRRFMQMRHYFDAFRIDHILGFFRIWTIPAHAVEGILGCFVPALPVEMNEFAARGIAFDRDRFTKPFINDAVLAEIFKEHGAMVRSTFLNANGNGTYSMRPEYATQQQVERYFAAQKKRDALLEVGVFDLITNVLLFEKDGKFHFRFDMEKTTSFKALPPDLQGKLRELYLDYFFRRQDDFWKRESLRKLPALKRVTNMLICGEDLGLVPACVPSVMRDLGLLSLEIQRMPKKMGQEFSRPADAPYLSVVTPSTHDMSTIRGWWEEEAPLTQKFYQRELGGQGEAPREAGPEIVQAVVQQHLASPAMWSIFQLQDVMGMNGQLRRANVQAERINIPADPKHYWRYRMHLTLEQLQKSENLNAELRNLIQQSGR